MITSSRKSPPLLKAIYFFVFLFLPAFVHSQTAVAGDSPTSPPLKIGFVDMELIVEESEAIRDIISLLDTEMGERAARIEELRAKVERLQRSLEQQASVLSDEEIANRQNEALETLRKLDEEEFLFRRELQRREQMTIEPLMREIIDVIGVVGAEQGYDLILRGEVVLYGAKTVDLTPVIVKEVDSRGEKLRKILFPKQPAPAGDGLPPAEGPMPEPTKEPIPLIP